MLYAAILLCVFGTNIQHISHDEEAQRCCILLGKCPYIYNIFPSLFDLALSVLGSVKPWCFPVCCPNRCPYFELHISHVCVVGVNKCEKIALAFCARFYLFLYLFLYFLSISFFFFRSCISLQGFCWENVLHISHPTEDLGSIPSSAMCRHVPEGIIGCVLKGSSLLLLLCNMPTG